MFMKALRLVTKGSFNMGAFAWKCSERKSTAKRWSLLAEGMTKTAVNISRLWFLVSWIIGGMFIKRLAMLQQGRAHVWALLVSYITIVMHHRVLWLSCSIFCNALHFTDFVTFHSFMMFGACPDMSVMWLLVLVLKHFIIASFFFLYPTFISAYFSLGLFLVHCHLASCFLMMQKLNNNAV